MAERKDQRAAAVERLVKHGVKWERAYADKGRRDEYGSYAEAELWTIQWIDEDPEQRRWVDDSEMEKQTLEWARKAGRQV